MTDGDSRTLHDALAEAKVAMVMTQVSGTWTSRPLTCVEVIDSSLRFLVDGSDDWVGDLNSASSTVHVSFSNPGENSYASMNGAASVSADRNLIERLWTAPASAHFDGPEDPDIRVLQVDVTDGSWWDGPSGRIGQTIGLLRAAINDDPSMAGGHGTIDV